MAHEPRLDMLGAQWLAEQRIVEQVDLPDREVVRCAPVRIDATELLLVERERLLRCLDSHGRQSDGRVVRSDECCPSRSLPWCDSAAAGRLDAPLAGEDHENAQLFVRREAVFRTSRDVHRLAGLEWYGATLDLEHATPIEHDDRPRHPHVAPACRARAPRGRRPRSRAPETCERSDSRRHPPRDASGRARRRTGPQRASRAQASTRSVLSQRRLSSVPSTSWSLPPSALGHELGHPRAAGRGLHRSRHGRSCGQPALYGSHQGKINVRLRRVVGAVARGRCRACAARRLPICASGSCRGRTAA